MSNEGSQTIQTISKNISLPLIFASGVIGVGIFVGMVQADVNRTKEEVKKFVPRTELDQRLGFIERDVSEIKTDVKSLLKLR